MKLKVVLTRQGWRIRLCRLLWSRGKPGAGGYSAAFSLGLSPRLFRWQPECYGWIACLFGVRVHYQRSYGGVIT